MQQSRSHREEIQCPVCYEQGRVLKEVCGNKHKICVKCMFNLIKRQCPICKSHFRLDWKEENGTNYQIIFGEEDREHNEIEEDNDEEAEIIRNYVRYLQQYEQYRQNLYQHQLYHHYYHNTHSHPYHQPTSSSNNNQYPLLSNPHTHQNPQHIHPSVTQIIPQNYQTESNMRNPQYRQHINERIRRERRARDQRMYGQTVRIQALLRVQGQQQAKEESCGLFDKVGQFFISIGQKLSSKKTQPAQKNNLQCNSPTSPLSSAQDNAYPQQNNRPQRIQSEIPSSNSHHYHPHNTLQHHYYRSNSHYAPHNNQNHHHHQGCPHHYYNGLNYNTHHQYPPYQYQHSYANYYGERYSNLQNVQQRH